MEKMSKENERKLLRALDKAATLSIGNSDPDDVLIKVATEYKLTPPELCRVVEAYNKAKSVAYLKKAAAEDRAADFPLASMEKISSRIYSLEKTESEAIIPLRDYASAYYNSPVMEKAASTEVLKAKRVETPRAPESVWKEAMDYFDDQKGLKTILVNRYRESMTKRAYALKNVADHCEHMRPQDLVKVARMIVNGYGEKLAEELISEINMNMCVNRLPQKIEKTAHAAIFPGTEPYISLSKVVELHKTASAAKQDVEWFEKTAEDESPLVKAVETVSAKVWDPDRPERKSLDIGTGMPTEWDNYLKELNAKRMLYNLYRFDPVLQSYPLHDVADTYNEVVSTTPGLADNKAWMRAALRRSLTQGKAVDPFEIKDMLMAQKEKTVGGKNYADMVASINRGSEGGGGGKRPEPPPSKSQEEEEGNA